MVSLCSMDIQTRCCHLEMGGSTDEENVGKFNDNRIPSGAVITEAQHGMPLL